MAQLSLSNVINISVSQAQLGASAYNTSNLMLFSTDTPGGSFPSSGYQIYKDPLDVASDFGSGSTTYQMALAIFSQQPNILANGGYLVIAPFLMSETFAAAITRTYSLVSYFGVMSTQVESQSHMLAAAAEIQALNLIGFFAQSDSATIQTGGALDLLRSGDFTQSRGLYFGSTSGSGYSAISPILFQAAYAGRGLSTVFSGSNTTSTMHLKPLATIQPDLSLTQTLLNDALAAGADTYPSLQGISAVFCSGANDFFDDVYNQEWFVGALQIAGFNYLAQAATKIPQTESGMDGLKGAYGSVCEQAVVNQYVAPGQWNSPTTFGNQADFYANIAQKGYYIFSTPISQQSESARIARQAPLVQIAIKLAGAIQSSDVIVYINQ